MKKYLLLGVFAMFLPNLVFAGTKSGYSVITKYGNETSINYRHKSNPKKWYVSAHADLSFLSWENEYTYGSVNDSDKFSLKPVIGADIALGCELDKNWRADLELGYIGNYSEQETEYYDNYYTEKTEFDLNTMYATVNAYYGFNSGVYIGAGAGAVVVQASLNHNLLAKTSKTNASPIGAFVFGWNSKMTEKTYFDIRYRLSVFSGLTLEDMGVKTKIDLITDNSLSVGVRYMF